MKSGIYSITNIINNKRYIGRAVFIKNRFATHKRQLKDNKHKNNYLQNAWNKYGEENLLFEILEECEENLLNIKETFYIKKYKSLIRENGHNLQEPNGQTYRQNKESNEKVRNFQLGKPKLKESIEKCKLTKLKNGYKSDPKICIQNAIKLRKKVYFFDLNGVFIKEFESTVEANKYFNLNNAISSTIKKGEKLCMVILVTQKIIILIF